MIEITIRIDERQDGEGYGLDVTNPDGPDGPAPNEAHRTYHRRIGPRAEFRQYGPGVLHRVTTTKTP